MGIGSVSTADGSALIRMGDTTMVRGIKAEIAEPDAARPNEGFIST
jgi:exosome complex component RRP43